MNKLNHFLALHRTKLAGSWHSLSKSQKLWLFVSLLVLIAAGTIVHHRSHARTSTPVGVYVAIMGVIVAGATFRKEPSLPEKAGWVLVATLFVWAEIINLYKETAEQTGRLTIIARSLEKTKTGIELAQQGINTTSSQISRDAIENQEQFNALIKKSDSALTKINEAAAIAKDTLGYVSGAGAYAVLRIVPSKSHGDSTFVVISNSTKFPIKKIHFHVHDIDALEEELKKPREQQQIQVETVADLYLDELVGFGQWGGAIGFRFDDKSSHKWNIQCIGETTSWDELLRMIRVNGQWKTALMITTGSDTLRKPTFIYKDKDYPEDPVHW
jgi:hypothetical protein